MDYKIESKPTLWWCSLSRGCYSDRENQDLFFRANDVDEAWLFLVEYLKETNKGRGLLCGTQAVIWTEDKKACVVDDPKDVYVDWDTDYGTAWGVVIRMLPVIYPQNFNIEK